MKIKKWSEFSINESVMKFWDSDIYLKYLNDNDKNKEHILESLYDVNEVAKIHINSYISNESTPENWSHSIEKDENYNIVNSINITLKSKLIPGSKVDFDDFLKLQEKLEIIKISIQETIDRCIYRKMGLISNKFSISNDNNGDVSFEFKILLKNEKLETDELYKVYRQHKDSFNESFIEGMDKLYKYYRRYGIEIEDLLDTMEDGGVTMIGVVAEDEIVVIAQYDSNSGRFTSFRDEIEYSIDILLGRDITP